LDTEAHFESRRAETRERTWTPGELWEQYEKRRTEKFADAPKTEINRLRNEIYENCLEAAELSPGLFRLTVPTGGGKTLSGMAFALRHALAHELRRIVVAIPYTSIIEQTAEEYRDFFGEAVLEHHSAVDWAADTETDPVSLEQLWPRLASQNWDAPIVVTTTVQLFESLFSNRPGACRKLHNLSGSVLILDEAQTLPPHLLAPILDALRELADHYRVSVVFCTATQPSVAVEPYDAVFGAAREIIAAPESYFAALSRVTYEVSQERWSWERVAEEMRTTDRCLAIVNTKRDALTLLDCLDDPTALHLSTNLCGAHRKRVLAEVRRRLKADEPCRLVSTQVVEAGVDLDFPLVLRALGPLDRIVQAAGRCNREGRLGPGGGRVVVFEPEAPSALPPGAYKTGTDTARRLFEEDIDLAAPASYETYFRLLSQAVELDRESIQESRAGWDYPRVARDFRLMDDDSLPIVVPYPTIQQTGARLEELRKNRGSARALFRQLQPFVVNGRRRSVARYASDGLATEVVPGLYQWWGRYDEIRGLVEEPGLTPEELII
jgi:CRISPR-associated endonuclease/helicase Cas3